MVNVEVLSPFKPLPQITFPDAKITGEQWEVSPVFEAPPSPVGSSSGCPRSALLSCAFKGADFLGSLVTICEMASVSLSLSTSWVVVERQRWYSRLKRQQGRRS